MSESQQQARAHQRKKKRKKRPRKKASEEDIFFFFLFFSHIFYVIFNINVPSPPLQLQVITLPLSASRRKERERWQPRSAQPLAFLRYVPHPFAENARRWVRRVRFPTRSREEEEVCSSATAGDVKEDLVKIVVDETVPRGLF